MPIGRLLRRDRRDRRARRRRSRQPHRRRRGAAPRSYRLRSATARGSPPPPAQFSATGSARRVLPVGSPRWRRSSASAAVNAAGAPRANAPPPMDLRGDFVLLAARRVAFGDAIFGGAREGSVFEPRKLRLDACLLYSQRVQFAAQRLVSPPQRRRAERRASSAVDHARRSARAVVSAPPSAAKRASVSSSSAASARFSPRSASRVAAVSSAVADANAAAPRVDARRRAASSSRSLASSAAFSTASASH